MKCGDRGHNTVDGTPCQQNNSADAKGCIWHSPARTPDQKHLTALKGGLMVRKRRLLPESYRMPPFDTRENVIKFAGGLARDVLTRDVDPRRVDTALRAAGVALTAFAQATQEKLVDALLTIEHGGAAMLLLTRLQDGLTEGRRRPLPGRALPLLETSP